MKILKFGGSSLGDADRLRKSAKIVISSGSGNVVVLSAMQGMTNLLQEAANLAGLGDSQYHKALDTLIQHHTATVKNLLKDPETFTKNVLVPLLTDLKEILYGIELLRECSPRSKDLVMSYGERLNCQIMAQHLSDLNHSAEYIDTRDLIVTDDNFSNASVSFDESYARIRDLITDRNQTYIVTGFIASTPDGITTTLGRNGSDYTASLFGAALKAEEVIIWTDVDGVLSADPRIVPRAFVIPEISLEEATEMAYFGAKVIHPFTLHPLIPDNIPCRIKNTFHPEAPGTLICKQDLLSRKGGITAIASIDNVSFLNITGSGMLGLPGVTSRIFNIFSRLGINIIMITQASSEHSLCILCLTDDAHKAYLTLNTELKDSFHTHYLDHVEIKDNLEIVAVIGDNMIGTPGISGKLFSALGQKKINIQAIAQGSSERNISFVIDKTDSSEAINTVHDTFFGFGE